MLGLTDDQAKWIGTLLAGGFATLYARRAELRSKDIQNEISGPKDEPSLRQMITAATEKLTRKQDEISDRVFSLHGLFLSSTIQISEIEVRLDFVETQMKGINLVTTSVDESTQKLNSLAIEIERIRLNLHNVANKLQVKVLTLEDFMSERKKNDDSATKQ